jgi:UDP-N-acetyl-D-glucosamine dehydrogenase
MKKIAVIGLGYVGLPLASLCAIKGYHVIGLEKKETVLNTLKNGKSHIKDHTVENLYTRAFLSGNIQPTSSINKIKDCNIYLICVPTPIDKNNDPDLEPLIASIKTISSFIDKGDLVVVESTVFPGTCEEILVPILDRLSNMKAGKDYNMAHCPERVNPGDLFWSSDNIPRVVGGTTEDATQAAAELYSSILGGPILDVRDIRTTLKPKFSLDKTGALKVAQIPLGSVTKMHSIRDAEAVKAMENTVRDVNIAFVNELAKISDVLNLDVIDIIDGMSTKPFGKGPFYPGVGVGGHCIAVDPEWLKAASKRAGYMPEIIQLARMTNNNMPHYSVSILQDLLNTKGYPINGTKIMLFGVAYKRNVDDLRESPFYDVRELLMKKGAEVIIFDSWVKTENTVDSLWEALQECKAIIIITEHSDMISELREINLETLPVEVIVDGRNCLDAKYIREQGILYRGIGRNTEN